MQRLRAYWASGWLGKVVLSVAGLLGASSCCCVVVLSIALQASPSTVREATAEIAVAQPTTEETDPTPNTIELAVATLEVLEAATPTVRPTRTPAPTRTPRPTEKPDRQVVRAADYGDAWPFAVESGTVRCVKPRNEIIFSSEGKVYAVNGTAKSNKDYADITPIWKDDPKNEGLKINLTPILDLGLSLC